MIAPITPDPELAALARRWLASYGQGDGAAIFNLLSDDPALTYVGTAEAEFGMGDTFRRAFKDYVEAHPRFEFDVEDASAFSCGAVGWAVCRGTVNSLTGRDLTVRVSLIYHMNSGFWRLVHVHNSLPSSNIDGIGQELAEFDDLVDAARAMPTRFDQTGLATIMFTDIADSTALAEAIGDNRWSDMVQTHVQLVGQNIEDHGGTLIKSLGDGTMSSFPSARAALVAATMLQRAMAAQEGEPRLQIRIGLHTGDLVAQDGDMFGTVVNKAARVAALAAPDDIRVSDATRIMVGSGIFIFADPVSTPLKGLEGEHVIHRLEWRR